MLRVRNLSLRAEKDHALQLSFELTGGEVLGVVGPSGSGKTSLIMALAGLLNYHGFIELYGKDLKEYRKEDLASHMGVVFEDPEPYFISHRVSDEVAFPLENMGKAPSDIASRVSESLRVVGLQDRTHDYVDELSSGQKHRLAIAGALVHDPELLLLDNPLAHLDPEMAREISSYILKVKSVGKSVIITGHEKRRLSLADRFVELGRGPPPDILPSRAMEDEPQDQEGSIMGDGISFAYKGHDYVVRDASFSLRRGEVVALMGKNGAGKTTLGKIMAGLLRPLRGKVSILGKKPGRNLSTYVFQNPDVQFIGRTVHEDVMYSIKARNSKSPSQRDGKSYLREVGLEDYAEKGVYTLSRGLKKLATIASGTALEPQVMVLDEPDSGLDPYYRSLVARAVSRMSEKGTSVVVITHDVDFARSLARRALVMREGRLVADVTINEFQEELM